MMASTQEHITNIVVVTKRLSDLVSAENEMIVAEKFADISARHEEKVRLADAYQHELEALRADPSWPRTTRPADIERLKAATRGFQEILERHRRLVVAAKTVTERLFKTIGDEVAKRRHPVKSYDSSATLKMTAGAGAAPAVSIALNQFV